MKVTSTLIAINSNRNVHGVCELPEDYCIRPLIAPFKITTENGKRPGDVEFCCSYSSSKAVAAIVQILLASITLYQSRGDQLDHYGYASFSLTIVPYIIMSIANLFVRVPYCFYSSMKDSDEAVRQGGRIEFAVGRLVETESNSTSEQPDYPMNSSSRGAPTNGTDQPASGPIRAGTDHLPSEMEVIQVPNISQRESNDFIEIKFSKTRNRLRVLIVPLAAPIFAGICFGIIEWLISL